MDLHRMIDSQNTDGAALFVNRETRKAHTRQGQIMYEGTTGGALLATAHCVCCGVCEWCVRTGHL